MRAIVSSFFVLCLHGTLATRVRHSARVTRPVRVHPACGVSQLTKEACPCAVFYDLLIEKCQQVLFNTLQGPGDYESDRDEIEDGCRKMVEALWTGQTPEKVIGETSHIIFLTQQSDDVQPSTTESDLTIAAFWAGFSWTLGTRQVLDKLLQRSRVSLKGNNSFRLEDIEYAGHGIGDVMRQMKWDRRCHKSKHDSQLWLSLSREYARGSNDARFRKEKPVVVVINYDVAKLPTTFLFQHEIALMQDFEEMWIVDYKNGCSEQLINLVQVKFPNKVVCAKGDDPNQMAGIFVRNGIAQSASKEIAELGSDISLLEKGYAPGIKWVIKAGTFQVGDRVQHIEFSESTGVVMGIESNGYGSSISLEFDDGQTGVYNARHYRIITKACDTSVLVKERSEECVDGSHGMKSLEVADFTKCQESCDDWKHCLHFTYDAKLKDCMLLHRDYELDYEHADEHIISGHRRR